MSFLSFSSMPEKLSGKTDIPVSKSIYNRALLLKHLSGNKIELYGDQLAEDSLLLKEILESDKKEINVQNAGTVLRFMLAYCSLKEGEWLLFGDKRMNDRPVGQLAMALRSLGAEINFLEKEGFTPIKVTGIKLKGGKVTIDSGWSSQFVSALMLIAPFLENGLEIHLAGNPVSFSYIRLTSSVLNDFGLNCRVESRKIIVEQGIPKITDYQSEADWSSTAFLIGISVIFPGSKLTFHQLKPNSMQGDAIAMEYFSNFGVVSWFEKEILYIRSNETKTDFFEADMRNCPDLVPVFATLCVCKKINFKITGISHLKYKESDRLSALASELNKLGAKVIPTDNSLECIEFKPFSDNGIFLKTFDDHRLAMAFSLPAILFPGIRIENPHCVGKSFPGYWNELKKLGFSFNIE